MKKCPKCNKTYDDSWKVCLSCQGMLIDYKEYMPTQQKDDELVLKDKIQTKGHTLIGIGGLVLIYSFMRAVLEEGLGFNVSTMKYTPSFKFRGISSLLGMMIEFAILGSIGLIIFYMGKRKLPKNIWYEIIFWLSFSMVIIGCCCFLFIVLSKHK